MFYILKWFLSIGIFVLILTTLIKNIDYYSYCKLAQYKKDLFEKNEKSKEFGVLCNDIFKDFSDHNLLKFSLNFVYNIMRPEYAFQHMSDESAIKIIDDVETSYMGTLKYNLKIFKFLNFAFYVMVIYIIFVILPDILTKIVIFILNKCLFILFLFFVAEGFLNFYTNVKINSINIVSTFLNYMPSTLFKYLYENASHLMSYLRSLLNI